MLELARTVIALTGSRSTLEFHAAADATSRTPARRLQPQGESAMIARFSHH